VFIFLVFFDGAKIQYFALWKGKKTIFATKLFYVLYHSYIIITL
jgi:hypothetical protein